MAVTVSALKKRGTPGKTPERTEFTLALDASYPAGGYGTPEGLTPAAAGFVNDLHAVLPGVAVDGAGNCLIAAWDETNNRLRVFYPTGGSVAAPATVAQPVGATGGTAVTSSAATLPITPGAGKEVPVGANLAGFTMKVTAWGA